MVRGRRLVVVFFVDDRDDVLPPDDRRLELMELIDELGL
jgi:hypothetical protein